MDHQQNKIYIGMIQSHYKSDKIKCKLNSVLFETALRFNR